MACPFFMPTSSLGEPLWPHPQRLPLGGGFAGYCTAPGHERYSPTADELRDGCNVGYAARCPQLPPDRDTDANRFRVTQAGAEVNVFHCSELRHAPVAQASLRFDLAAQTWTASHPDACLQRQAECALESWLAQRPSPRGSEPISRS